MTETENCSELQTSFLMDKLQNPAYEGNVEERSDSPTETVQMSNLEIDNVNSADVSENLNFSRTADNSANTVTESCSVPPNSFENTDISSEESKPKSEDEWLDIMGSGNFKKKIIKPGLGHETRPGRGDMVIANVTYYMNGVSFEEQENLKFIVGDLDVIQGIDLVVCLMEKGEKAKVIIPSKLAYGKVGRSPDVPSDCDIECDIEILEVETVDESSLTVAKRLQLGNEKRTRGNFFYDRGQYIDAIHCYERAGEYLDGIRDCSGSSVEESQEIVDMRIKVFNNMAASHLKLCAYGAALKSVESVLKIQPRNVKALFRKGKILALQGSIDEAIACMNTAAKLEPQTKIIHLELNRMKNKKKKEEESQKAMYQRMFPQSEPKKSNTVSMLKKWSVIAGGLVAVAAGMVAYRVYHT